MDAHDPAVPEGDSDKEPSPALLEANRKLYRLRARLQEARAQAASQSAPAEDDPAAPESPGEGPPGASSPAGPAQPDTRTPGREQDATRSEVEDFALPDHLGWGSDALARHLRAGRRRRQQEADRRAAERLEWLSRPGGAHNTSDSDEGNKKEADKPRPPHSKDEEDDNKGGGGSGSPGVRLYPDIALALLKQELAAPGRLWLLLRHLDRAGRGWLALDHVRDQVASAGAPHRICGKRQLRNLLNEGEGLFWTRSKRPDGTLRLWLRGAARVAADLGVERLRLRPVALPLSALLGGVGEAKAHFYASFFAGRKGEAPISRQTLAEITGVPPRTQLTYEALAGVDAQQSIAVGEHYDDKAYQERAWQHGRATFIFVDHQGKQGKPGKAYVAWWLPNRYEGCHRRRPRGRMKKINQKLTDLVNKRERGNGERQVDRIFHANGKAAGKRYNRNPEQDAYWPAQLGGPAGRRQVWFVLPGEVT